MITIYLLFVYRRAAYTDRSIIGTSYNHALTALDRLVAVQIALWILYYIFYFPVSIKFAAAATVDGLVAAPYTSRLRVNDYYCFRKFKTNASRWLIIL